MSNLYDDSKMIIQEAIASALPDAAVKKALQNFKPGEGRLILISIGKAGWQMIHAAEEILKDQVTEGICITKYHHVMGSIPHVRCFEAGHPVPDDNSIAATQEAEHAVSNLSSSDQVLFLVSGGGSALFEDPVISLNELKEVTQTLLACGAEIDEINTIRKRLSKVKGGKFAQLCYPAEVHSIILSDIIGDPLDMIASGPTVPDHTTKEDVQEILSKYHLSFPADVMAALNTDTPKQLVNSTVAVTGSVKQLCASVMKTAERLGYEPHFLTASLTCEAREAGSFLAAIARDHQNDGKDLAYICGGETIVHLTGKGLGGRNQELALSAAAGIDGLKNCCIFSVGSDGTDGPTDAAGGYADTATASVLKSQHISIQKVLSDNDAYHALEKCGGLIMTGPTGTNVNDFSVLLIRGNNR